MDTTKRTSDTTSIELFKIDDNIPVPEITRRSKKASRLTATLSALRPGKSFFVPNMDVKRISPEVAKIKRTLGRVSFTTRTAFERDPESRKVVPGVRVWRDVKYVENKRQRLSPP